MALPGWLKQIGSTVSKGVSWIGKNVVAPATTWLKQNVPAVGGIIDSAKPLGDFLQKSADYSADFYGDVPPAKRRAKPSMGELGGAIKSGVETFGKLRGAGVFDKMASMTY